MGLVFAVHNNFSQSCGIEDSRSQQDEPRSAVHLPFDRLQAIDVSFHRTIAPPLRHAREHGGFVAPDAFGKSSYFRTGGRFAFYQPITQRPT
jgi:hypothetical protein